MRVLHAVVNRAPWASSALARIDDALVDAGSTPLDVDVGAYGLEDDGEHYTRPEYVRFCADLARELRRRGVARPLVVADSTVDHHNYVEGVEWTGWAGQELHAALGGVVDAVRGSGFVARAYCNEHAHARVSYHLRANADVDAVVLLLGWNDAHRARDAAHAARAVVGCASRYA